MTEFTYACYSGVEVHRYPRGGETFTPEQWEDYISIAPLLTEENDLKEKDNVIFQFLFGSRYVKATIVRDDLDPNKFWAVSGGTVWNLDFNTDERHCWVVGFNTNSIQKIQGHD